ncbi:MAG: RNA-binding protein [Candidatus Hecatellales archaeon B24]|nr:MAG: RNA-binding protein [Candidatus Hecatellales archaeon B24]
MSLGEILSRVGRELKTKNALREHMLTEARRVLKLSKESIILVHRGKFKAAEKRVETAGGILRKTLKRLEEFPELKYGGAMFNACQEYAEAYIFLKLEKEERFPTPEEVGVGFQAYLLGLADVPGELRRRALDALMAGDFKGAEGRFNLMEEIYGGLSTLDEQIFSLVSGLRRKCDVIRHLLELTGSDLLVEKRQQRLEKALKTLEKHASKIGRKRG